MSPEAEILTIGTELLLGQIVDSNSAWLGEQLLRLGIALRRVTTVGDTLDDVVDAMRDAAARVPLVIATGGLGPTDDDLTREAAAAAAGVSLIRDEQLLADIESFFARRGRPMPAINACQADRPEGSTPIHNPVGTAPAFALPIGEARLFALPGVPREMRHLFETEVASRLPQGEPLFVRVLHVCGMGESAIGAELAGLPFADDPRDGPVLGTMAHEGQVDLRLVARDADAIAPVEAEIRARLGAAVFGADEVSLADAVARVLRRRGWTLAVAETHTGGALASQLVHSGVLHGAVVAPPDGLSRLPGAPVDRARPTAIAVARALAEQTGADVGLALLAEASEDVGPHTGRAGEAACGAVWPGGQAAGRLVAGAQEIARGWSIGLGLALLWRHLGGDD